MFLLGLRKATHHWWQVDSSHLLSGFYRVHLQLCIWQARQTTNISTKKYLFTTTVRQDPSNSKYKRDTTPLLFSVAKEGWKSVPLKRFLLLSIFFECTFARYFYLFPSIWRIHIKGLCFPHIPVTRFPSFRTTVYQPAQYKFSRPFSLDSWQRFPRLFAWFAFSRAYQQSLSAPNIFVGSLHLAFSDFPETLGLRETRENRHVDDETCHTLGNRKYILAILW